MQYNLLTALQPTFVAWMKYIFTYFLLLFTFLASGYSHVIPVSVHSNQATVHRAQLHYNKPQLFNQFSNIECDDETEEDESDSLKKTSTSLQFKQPNSFNIFSNLLYKNQWKNNLLIAPNANRYLLLSVLRI